MSCPYPSLDVTDLLDRSSKCVITEFYCIRYNKLQTHSLNTNRITAEATRHRKMMPTRIVYCNTITHTHII